MAAELVGGAVLGTALSELYTVLKDAVRKAVWCKKYCKELVQDLDTHIPIFRQISNNMQRPVREWEQHLLVCKDTLEQGRLLVEACIQLHGWHPRQRYCYSKAILKLRQEIGQHLRDLASLNTLQLQQVNTSLQDVVNEQDKLRQDISPVLQAVMSGDTILLPDLMRANITGTHEGQTSTQLAGKRLNELPLEHFLVGVHNPVEEVKSLLLSGEEKMVLIVDGMGGIGKTTLALSICKDRQVREFFKDQIHFFTVSQSPNMKGLLSTIWQQVVGEPLPVFQNEEDACRQLKGRLLSMSSDPRLLVLDDVWSKVNLQNLLFEVHCCRTLITTRQADALKTHNSQTYTLRLLNEENAQRLFCYWAFRQDSIPKWAEETIVKEVILECKCLPLALKVLGSSLSGDVRAPMAWRKARDRLREAKIQGDYRDGVFQRLQTSVDALDATLRECFLDLGAFPEDSRCSINALLDIWVYVRGMEWEDAVLALAELSSRCLLDIHRRRQYEVQSLGERNDFLYELEYDGNASNVKFSQHDVMRDLALYMCRGNEAPSKCSRLLMPCEGQNIPKDWWQSEAPLEAQLVSISTGAMMEQDWPSMLAFPSTEALHLYCDKGDYYHLPLFVQSMCKLKVMRIRSSKLRDMQPERFGNLSNLTVLDIRSHCLKHLPTTFGPVVALKKLYLSHCTALRELPERIAELSCLEELSLKACTRLECLPASFGQLVRLEWLDLSSCRDLKDLPETFGLLSNLKWLYLTNCKGLTKLPERFGELSCLEDLSLKGCMTLERLPASFGQLVALQRLDLSSCGGMKDLPEKFGLLSNLKQLELQGCWGLTELPDSFGELSCLEQLSLKGCVRLERLPVSFGQMCSLEFLNLGYCRGLKQLPVSFGQLSKLRTWKMERAGLENLPMSVGVGSLVGLKNVECSEKLVPIWKAVRGDIPPHPKIRTLTEEV